MQMPKSELEILPPMLACATANRLTSQSSASRKRPTTVTTMWMARRNTGFVGRDESRRGGIRGRRARRAGRDGPAQHHVDDRQRHHQQHAQDAGRRFDRRAVEDGVEARGDDPHEEHRGDHRPELGEPADDGVVLAFAADQLGDRRAHLPHRPQDDGEAQRM